jgi:hypothetical protein
MWITQNLFLETGLYIQNILLSGKVVCLQAADSFF